MDELTVWVQLGGCPVAAMRETRRMWYARWWDCDVCVMSCGGARNVGWQMRGTPIGAGAAESHDEGCVSCQGNPETPKCICMW